jgi:hypothetical protein
MSAAYSLGAIVALPAVPYVNDVRPWPLWRVRSLTSGAGVGAEDGYNLWKYFDDYRSSAANRISELCVSLIVIIPRY